MSVQLNVCPTNITVIQMYMISCMIGPPSGLNLRNILWHGFASPSEISQELVMLESAMYGITINVYTLPLLCFRYATLFFVIVSSLGKILQSTLPSLHFNRRPFITFPQETHFANIFTGKFIMPILYTVMFIKPSLFITY